MDLKCWNEVRRFSVYLTYVNNIIDMDLFQESYFIYMMLLCYVLHI